MLAIILLLAATSYGALAGTVGAGGTCAAVNDHLDTASHKFVTECTDQTFCSALANGTCVPRLCRRDEYPFGIGANEPLPPQCASGSYCPDNGSGCRPLGTVGASCQLNRDEQCAPPLDWQDFASPQNFNGSICLHSLCMYANITLGQPCITDYTTYIDIGPDGHQYSNTITRDNCRSPQFYCDPAGMTCERTKTVGSPCLSDVECESYNCGSNAACADPPETPFRVASWQWVITALSILGAMIATCVMLTLIHKRHRYEHHKELREYYFEQLSLRRSIIALHAAAVDRYIDEKR